MKVVPLPVDSDGRLLVPEGEVEEVKTSAPQFSSGKVVPIDAAEDGPLPGAVSVEEDSDVQDFSTQ